MQDELVRLFVKDTNHATISRLPGISSAVAQIKAGTEWKITFVLKARHNVHMENVSSPKVIITKSAGKNEQIFILETAEKDWIWIYPESVCIGTTEIYNKDMFLDPSKPTPEEIQMLEMAKGVELGSIMKGFGMVPGKILERLMSGMFVEEYVTAEREKVIVLVR